MAKDAIEKLGDSIGELNEYVAWLRGNLTAMHNAHVAQIEMYAKQGILLEAAADKLAHIDKAVRWLDTFEAEPPCYEDLDNVLNQIRDVLGIAYAMS